MGPATDVGGYGANEMVEGLRAPSFEHSERRHAAGTWPDYWPASWRRQSGPDLIPRL
jgi:hypothetical protein